jgi:formylmethanofuran dehydrogenase subunit E
MKDVDHLLRVVAVFLLAGLAFLGVRAYLVPHSFGEYGHYRGNAIAEIASLPASYAGHQTCEMCHTDIFEQKSKGKHAGVACEACHGPQAKHADDPGSILPQKPDASVLCAQCHEASAAKPKWFPQVVTADHAGGMICTACHQAHSPSLGRGPE